MTVTKSKQKLVICPDQKLKRCVFSDFCINKLSKSKDSNPSSIKLHGPPWNHP